MPELPAPVERKINRRELFRDNSVSIVLSAPAKTSIEEGLNLTVNSVSLDNHILNVRLHQWLAALGAAKIVAESAATPGAWANTRDTESDVFVFERRAGVEKSWRRPVPSATSHRSRFETIDKTYNINHLQRLFGKFMPIWQRISHVVHVFEKDGDTIGTDVFEELPHAYILWRSESLDLVLIKEPHIPGLHFVASPREGYSRQWQTKPGSEVDQLLNRTIEQPNIRTTLESFTLLFGLRELLRMGGEIHNSSNWSKNLQNRWEGNLAFDELSEDFEREIKSKGEKRLHRPDIVGRMGHLRKIFTLGTYAYTHLYIPFDENQVLLPLMSKDEAQVIMNTEKITSERYKMAKISLARWSASGFLKPGELLLAKNTIHDGKLSRWLTHNIPR